MCAISGCFSDESPILEAGNDRPQQADASVDVLADVGVDLTHDSADDLEADANPDSTVDGGPDSTLDRGPDTTVDVGPDTTVDVGPDTTVDTGPDTTVDLTHDSQILVIGADATSVTTLAGSSIAGSANGPGVAATFDNPVNVALDKNGDLYVTDFNNGMVRKVTLAGEVSTIVDQPDFERPFGLAFSPSGELYVQTDVNDLGRVDDDVTGTIWHVDRTQGKALVVARDLGRPRGLAAISDTQLVMSDGQHHVLRVLDTQSGIVTPLAGLYDTPGFVDGAKADARFSQPYDIDILPDGRLVLADRDNHAIRAVTLAGVVTTLAGTNTAGWVDGPASDARFFQPQGLATDTLGNIYITQRGVGLVRRLDTTGHVTTVAGLGSEGFRDHPDNPLQARFFATEGITALPNGSLLFVADGNGGDPLPYHRIRQINVGARSGR